MTTNRIYKKAIAAAAAAIGIPAMMFAGAGTAQAYPQVSATSTGLYGVRVVVESYNGNGTPRSGNCTYSSQPILGTTDPGNLVPLPVYGVPFSLTAHGSTELWFPGVATGTDWKSVVNCTVGGTSTHYVTW